MYFNLKEIFKTLKQLFLSKDKYSTYEKYLEVFSLWNYIYEQNKIIKVKNYLQRPSKKLSTSR